MFCLIYFSLPTTMSQVLVCKTQDFTTRAQCAATTNSVVYDFISIENILNRFLWNFFNYRLFSIVVRGGKERRGRLSFPMLISNGNCSPTKLFGVIFIDHFIKLRNEYMLSVEEKVKVKVKVTESQYNLSSHTPETCNEERKKERK